MIYVSSSCVRQRYIAEAVEALAKNGVCNIELSGGTEYYEDLIRDLRSLKQTYGLNYACHAYFPPPKVPFVVNLASCNDYIYKRSLEHYVQCIDMLKSMDIKILSIHAGFLVEIGTEDIGGRLNRRIIYDEGEAYDRFFSAYERIRHLCIQNRICLFLENNVLSTDNYTEFGKHNYMMMTDYTSIMRMKEILDFDLLLDLGHLHVSANTLKLNYGEECRKLKSHVRWIHISENNGFSDEHKPLTEESEIFRMFLELYHPRLNVTLETNGDVGEIVAGIEMVKKHTLYLTEEQR